MLKLSISLIFNSILIGLTLNYIDCGQEYKKTYCAIQDKSGSIKCGPSYSSTDQSDAIAWGVYSNTTQDYG